MILSHLGSSKELFTEQVTMLIAILYTVKMCSD